MERIKYIGSHVDKNVSHPTQRFTKTIDYYHHYRPTYPREVVNLIVKESGIDKSSSVVDVGSGTGIFTEQLLNFGCHVYAVEPNQEMREYAEGNLQQFPNFESIDGTAENLSIPDNSVELITAAQAFHWFDTPLVKPEFYRVLKQDGWVVLLWNFRNNYGSEMMRAYEELLSTYGTDYKDVAAENVSESDVEHFFKPNTFQSQVYENVQTLDLEGLKGRLLSTSYTPKPGDSNFEGMMTEAEKIYREYQKDGFVELLYHTTVYYGQFGSTRAS